MLHLVQIGGLFFIRQVPTKGREWGQSLGQGGGEEASGAGCKGTCWDEGQGCGPVGMFVVPALNPLTDQEGRVWSSPTRSPMSVTVRPHGV